MSDAPLSPAPAAPSVAPAAASAPTPAPAPAPSAPAPSTRASSPSPAPASSSPLPAVTKPVVSPAVSPSTAPVTAPPKSSAGSILSDAASQPEAPPESPATDAKPAEATASEGIKYDLKRPEGFTVDETQLGRYTGVAAQLGISPEGAQRLFDLYAADMRAQADAMQARWTDLRKEWVTNFEKDPEIGGNRRNTTINNCAAFLQRYGDAVGEAHLTALKQVFRETGAGDHPALIRFVDWAAGLKRSRSASAATEAPAKKSVSVPRSRAAKRYTGTVIGNRA